MGNSNSIDIHDTTIDNNYNIFIQKCNTFETNIDFYSKKDIYHSPLGIITDTSQDDYIINIDVNINYDIQTHEISKILCFYILYIIQHKCIIQRQHKFNPSLYFIQSLLSEYCFKKNKTSIRDCLYCVQEYGVIDTLYYNKTSNIDTNILSIAKDYNNITFSRIHNRIGDIKNTLHANIPIIIQLPIYSHFIDIGVDSDGEYTMPDDNDTLIGSLCGLLIGFIESKNMYVVKICIANNFGDQGVIYIPYTFIDTYVKDLWILDVHIDFFENYKKIKKYEKIIKEKNNKKNENDVDKKQNNRSKIRPKIVYF